MTREEAEGTTSTLACRFWIVSWTVTRRPFHAEVALAISSPTFFGDCIAKWFDTLQTIECKRDTYETKRTDFRGKRRRCTNFTSSCPQVDDLNFVGVLRMRQLSRS